MSDFSLKPITGSQVRIIVEPAPADTKTPSGLIIPESGKEKPQRGIVVAVGNNLKEDKAIVKVDDNVLYGKYSGTELKWEGKDYLIMRESDVLAII